MGLEGTVVQLMLDALSVYTPHTKYSQSVQYLLRLN